MSERLPYNHASLFFFGIIISSFLYLFMFHTLINSLEYWCSVVVVIMFVILYQWSFFCSIVFCSSVFHSSVVLSSRLWHFFLFQALYMSGLVLQVSFMLLVLIGGQVSIGVCDIVVILILVGQFLGWVLVIVCEIVVILLLVVPTTSTGEDAVVTDLCIYSSYHLQNLLRSFWNSSCSFSCSFSRLSHSFSYLRSSFSCLSRSFSFLTSTFLHAICMS